MTPPRRPAVIFVNFHSEAMIEPRARHLRDEGFMVVVVDNSTSFPAMADIAVVQTGSNRGFARACNIGAAEVGHCADTLCFHNPDVDISGADIRRLVDAIGGQARPGLVAPAEVVGGVARPNGYHYPGPLREALVVAKWLRRRGPSGESHSLTAKLSAVRSGGRRFGSAALLVADAEAFRGVGGFDGRYFMYGEDLDLWHRVAASGRDCGFDSDVRANHADGQGSPLPDARRELYRWVGVELFAALNDVGWWPSFRAVHRSLLPLLARRSPELAGALRKLWSEGAHPERVAETLFPQMAAA